MKIAIHFFIALIFSLPAWSQSNSDDVLDDDFQISFGNLSPNGSTGIGIGWHALAYDDIHFTYENYLMYSLTYSLYNDGSFDKLSWSSPNISHGLFGDASLRYTISNPFGFVTSAGFSLSHYLISGFGDYNGNYFTGGLSLGLNFPFSNDFGLFTRFQFSKAYHGINPLQDEKVIPNIFTEIQAILKWKFLSIDYGRIMVGGNSSTMFRAGLWLDLM